MSQKPEKFELWHRRQPLSSAKSSVDEGIGGVYLIYKGREPFYIGRSTNNIRGRLVSHFNGYGNAKVRAAIRAGVSLEYTYAEVISFQQMEAQLIEHLGGPGVLGNLRKESDPADRF